MVTAIRNESPARHAHRTRYEDDKARRTQAAIESQRTRARTLGFRAADDFRTGPSADARLRPDGSLRPVSGPTPIRGNGAGSDTSRMPYETRGDSILMCRPTRPVDPPPVEPAKEGDAVPSETVADYRVGPPSRPDIRHDNGFLQNPNDPNDPNPIPTEGPGWSDYKTRLEWEAKLRGAQAVQGVPGVPHNDISDGLDAYDHFLHGDGKDRTFSYDRFVENDPAGQTTLQNTTRDVQQAAEAQYAEMIRKDPSLAGKPVTFDITGSAIAVGGNDGRFPYPGTENWQKAIGGHQIWPSATVTVNPPSTPDGKPELEMRMTVHAEDRYNFNPGAQDIATETPDAENGALERTGLAHQYMNYGTLERDVRWGQGDIESATSSKPGGR